MKVVIIGAGGHGRVVLDTLRQARQYDPAGFIDADTTRAGQLVSGLPVLGPINLLTKLRKQDIRAAIVAIGDNRIRQGYADEVAQAGLELINAIHPSATVSPSVKLGRNILLAAGAILSPEVEVADSVIVNTGAIIDHECRLGLACHVCPGVVLAGRVTVEEKAMVGLGARVLPCLTIGARATVGAGAVVIEDVPPGATVAGVPAKTIQR
jgi:UDP-perosamine 4-acetyltransferase